MHLNFPQGDKNFMERKHVLQSAISFTILEMKVFNFVLLDRGQVDKVSQSRQFWL